MIISLLNSIDSYLWDVVLIPLIVVVSIIYSVRSKFVQLHGLPGSFTHAFSDSDSQQQGEITQFQSLMTALAATVGIASITGVATAIVTGGFGAIFWMWIMAFIGMATKYSEAYLAVKYRTKDPETGEVQGGPMYYIQEGLKAPWLATLFALFGTFSAFAGGNLTQANTIALATQDLFGVPTGVVAAILGAIVAYSVIRGIHSIAIISSVLVPVMALMYVCSGILVLIYHYREIVPVILMIVHAAFDGQAAVGGFLGASVMSAIHMGFARGISSSEAGLGSAPIVAAAAKTPSPQSQGLVSMSATFISTFIICTITALAIGVTASLGDKMESGVMYNGAALVMHAFAKVLPGGEMLVGLAVILFGFSTIIGWAYYGEKCISYIVSSKYILVYRCIFLIFTVAGCLLSLEVVWPIVDIANGLMALPNLIALGLLYKEIKVYGDVH